MEDCVYDTSARKCQKELGHEGCPALCGSSFRSSVAVAKGRVGGVIEMRWSEDGLQLASDKAGKRRQAAAVRKGRERCADGTGRS